MRDKRPRSVRQAPDLPVGVVLRLLYVSSAEAYSRRTRGRPLTNEELSTVIRRYDGVFK